MARSSFSGSGDVYACPVNASGTKTGDYRFLGNVYPLTIQVQTEQKKQISRQTANAGQTLDTLTRISESGGNMILRQWDAENLAWALSAATPTAQTASGSTVTNEAVVAAAAGKYTRTAKRGLSSVVVTHKEGDDASGWVANTAYVLGDYIIPTTPNGRFYKCTTAGTSAAVTEPTWPTTLGATVADGAGALVWTDMGTITAVSGTDYSVETTLGMIKTLSGGAIVENETLNVDYAYAAESGYQIAIGGSTLIRVALFAKIKNEYTDEVYVIDLDSVVLSPSSEINFISEPDNEYEELPFTLSLETLDGNTSPGTVNGVPL